MDSDILTADDLQLGDEMFVEYGKKNNLSNEQNAFIDLWSAKDRIDEKQTKLLKTLIKVYRQEKRLKNARLKSNSEYQRNRKQQIKNDKDRAYKLLKLINNMNNDRRLELISFLISNTIDKAGFSQAVDLFFKSEHEKHDFIKYVNKNVNPTARINLVHAVELTLVL